MQEQREGAEPVEVRVQPGLVVTSSLARGRHPPPGSQAFPFVWDDILDGPPPRRKTRGEGAHATYHGTEVGEDLRLSYTTLVRVDPGLDLDSPDDDTVYVDVRVSVQRRALGELIDRERAFSDRLASRSRARLAQSLVRQRRAANALRAKWALAAAISVIRFQAKVGYAAIRGFRGFMHGLVRVPDALLSRTLSAATHLNNRYGRRTLVAGLRDPSILTHEQKGVVFFLSLALLVGSILVLSNVFTILFPQGARVYSRLLQDGIASLLSILALPIPSEPLLIRTTLEHGPVAAFAGSFLGKMVGVWLLFFLGDSLLDSIQRATSTKPRLRRVVDWMGHNANRYGFPILIAVNAVPFVPDVLMYVFAVSGMKYRPYMTAIAVGTTIKFVAVIASVMLIGPDRVSDFFASPFG